MRLTLLAAAVRPASTAAAKAAEVLRLWPAGAPGGGGPGGCFSVNERGAVANVASPILEAFRPRTPNGSAVLIAAGGGYKQIENGLEAYPAADWIVALGMTAFVLTYRLPGEGWAAGPASPLQDAHRAIRLIRSISHDHRSGVSVLGFSAGGHVLGMASAWSDRAAYQPLDAIDRYTCRPDGTALVYPVVTMKPPYDSPYTRRQLLGETASAAICAEWSVESHVSPGMPATFLAHADDDPVSNVANSEIMATACRKAGTPVDLQRYATGGHGFRMGKPGTASMAWPKAYAAWLHTTGLLK